MFTVLLCSNIGWYRMREHGHRVADVLVGAGSPLRRNHVLLLLGGVGRRPPRMARVWHVCDWDHVRKRLGHTRAAPLAGSVLRKCVGGGHRPGGLVAAVTSFTVLFVH